MTNFTNRLTELSFFSTLQDICKANDNMHNKKSPSSGFANEKARKDRK